MRQKKHKRAQRILTFLKIHNQFREPYKVVLDGNFINALLQTGSDAAEHIGKLLSAPVKVYTSRCVLNELKQLGPDFRDALAASRNFMVLHCGHEDDPQTAAACLRSLIGDNNPEHMFIASQDKQLRNDLAKVPGAAMVFASVNGLHLEAPSAVQKAEASAAVAEHMKLGDHEKQTDALASLAEPKPASSGKGIFKRKKAKGPNPLAVRKKKAKHSEGAGQPKQHRKRSRRKGGQQMESAAAG